MKVNKWVVLLIMISIIGTGIIYPYLPDQVPAHWNMKGEIDRVQDKIWTLFTAALPLLLYFLMIYLPKIDPKRVSYSKHMKAYGITKTLIVIFLILIHWITIGVALGYDVNVGAVVRIALGILFIGMGNYMGQIRHNYFFGIKTPWTLASEVVWKKTHRVGGYGFVILGIITMVSVLLEGSLGFTVMMISIFGIIGYLTLYSYFVYRKL